MQSGKQLYTENGQLYILLFSKLKEKSIRKLF